MCDKTCVHFAIILTLNSLSFRFDRVNKKHLIVCKDKHRRNFTSHCSLFCLFSFSFGVVFWCFGLWRETNKQTELTNTYHTSFRSNLIIFNPAHVFGFYHKISNASSTFSYTSTTKSTITSTTSYNCTTQVYLSFDTQDFLISLNPPLFIYYTL